MPLLMPTRCPFAVPLPSITYSTSSADSLRSVASPESCSTRKDTALPRKCILAARLEAGALRAHEAHRAAQLDRRLRRNVDAAVDGDALSVRRAVAVDHIQHFFRRFVAQRCVAGRS